MPGPVSDPGPDAGDADPKMDAQAASDREAAAKLGREVSRLTQQAKDRTDRHDESNELTEHVMEMMSGTIEERRTAEDRAAKPEDMALTHYGVVIFGGDPAAEHAAPELRQGPSMRIIAQGSEEHCWHALQAWTAKHPLRRWEEVEVLARDPSVVRHPSTEERPAQPEG